MENNQNISAADARNLVLGFAISREKSTFNGKLIAFQADLDVEAQPKGRIFSPSEHIWFVVIPAHSWNDLQRTLLQATLTEKQRNLLTIGWSFRIPDKNVLLKSFPEDHVEFLLQLVFECEPQTNDILNSVRWGRDIIDPEQFPFVVATRYCWNQFQTHIDEFGLREILRTNRPAPMAIPINESGIFYMTPEQFSKVETDKIQ